MGLAGGRLAALTAVVAACGLLTSCDAGVPMRSGTSSAPSSAPQTTTSGLTGEGDSVLRGPPVIVDGVAVVATAGLTVAEALHRARVHPQNGRLVSVGTHRTLRQDLAPATYLIDGVPARPDTRLTPGARLTMIAAPAKVEATALRQGQTPADPSGVGLYVGGSPGRTESLVGALSGEVVWTRVVRAPLLGRLRHPGSVSLTFDDGPDPAFTPAILQILAVNHIHAVFCLIGSQAQRHPGLVRRLLAAGHVLCDHTQDHDEGLARRGARRIHSDIAQGAASILRSSHGTHPRFFRAPGGNWSARMEAEVRAQHMTPLRWTVDPRDWALPGVEQITDVVLSQLRPGGVVLLHDGGGNRSQTVEALPRLIETLTGAGYYFATP